MVEKRKAVRYRHGGASNIAFLRPDGEFVRPLVDLSTTGLMAAVQEGEGKLLRPGDAVHMELRRPAGSVSLRGIVIHCSPFRRGLGVGIAFTDGMARDHGVSSLGNAVEDPESGGLRLQRGSDGIVLHVLGRLSFATSRDCLALVHRHAVSQIDLTECRGIDSSGLGMLCLARDRKIAVVGAAGIVKQMLTVTRILEPRR